MSYILSYDQKANLQEQVRQLKEDVQRALESNAIVGETNSLDIAKQKKAIQKSNNKVSKVEQGAIISSEEEFYLSLSPTALLGGAWSIYQPKWEQGKYLWRRTVVTRGDGSESYSPSKSGVCITGNTGEDAATLKIFSSNGVAFKNNKVSTELTVLINIGGAVIADVVAMKKRFGDNAKLIWEEKKNMQSNYVTILPTDKRVTNDGFTLLVTPKDVDNQTVFNCKLDC